MMNKSSNKSQRHLKCCQSGKISSHLVTLQQQQQQDTSFLSIKMDSYSSAIHFKFKAAHLEIDALPISTNDLMTLSTFLFLECANHGLFYCLFSFFQQRFNRKIVYLSGIRTRIVRAEGEHADHLTNTTAFCLHLNSAEAHSD